MTVFYRGPCVHITHEVFQLRCPSRQEFAIRQLRHVHVVELKGFSALVGSPVRVGSIGLAGAAAVLAVLGWPVLNSPLVALVGMVVLVMSSVAAACCRVGSAPPRELWAVYQGRLTCLFRTTDTRRFGQISRALLRAVEQAADR